MMVSLKVCGLKAKINLNGALTTGNKNWISTPLEPRITLLVASIRSIEVLPRFPILSNELTREKPTS